MAHQANVESVQEVMRNKVDAEKAKIDNRLDVQAQAEAKMEALEAGRWAEDARNPARSTIPAHMTAQALSVAPHAQANAEKKLLGVVFKEEKKGGEEKMEGDKGEGKEVEALDLDHDGNVSRAEKAVDEDHDGKLSKEELAAIDTDQDGVLTKEEVHDRAKSLHQKASETADQMKMKAAKAVHAHGEAVLARAMTKGKGTVLKSIKQLDGDELKDQKQGKNPMKTVGEETTTDDIANHELLKGIGMPGPLEDALGGLGVAKDVAAAHKAQAKQLGNEATQYAKQHAAAAAAQAKEHAKAAAAQAKEEALELEHDLITHGKILLSFFQASALPGAADRVVKRLSCPKPAPPTPAASSLSRPSR